MRRLLPLVLFVFAITFALAAPQPQEQEEGSSSRVCKPTGTFHSTCNPYGSSSSPHAIDKSCGMTGSATSDGDKAQDAQKNNLCSSGTPHPITIADLKTLQLAVDKAGVDYGSEHTHPPHAGPPADRASLFVDLSLGSVKEGDLVSFVGYIAEVKQGSSETVNCECPDKLSTDVHIAVADHPLTLKKATSTDTPAEKHAITVSNDADLCTNSFVAETTPHMRPAAFELDSVASLAGNKIVRLTGPLLFDASHRPCKGSVPGTGDPARLTVFEIHPVYKIEVCAKASPAQCDADPGNWQAFSGSTTTKAKKTRN